MTESKRYPGGFHLKLSDLIPDREIDSEKIKRFQQLADRSLGEPWIPEPPKRSEPSGSR